MHKNGSATFVIQVSRDFFKAVRLESQRRDAYLPTSLPSPYAHKLHGVVPNCPSDLSCATDETRRRR